MTPHRCTQSSSDRLSALDAAFLYLEAPDTPMHVGTLSRYDGSCWRDSRGRLDLAGVRRHVQARLDAIPRLRQHPVWPTGRAGRPRWADDATFDLDRHVRMVRLSQPAGERMVRLSQPAGERMVRLSQPAGEQALLDLVASLHMTLLDRAHPLWELWFVDGLAGGDVAVIEKIHHALVDGIGGVDLAMMLLDVTPAPPPDAGIAVRPAGDAASRPSSPAGGWRRLPVLGLVAAAVAGRTAGPVGAARAAAGLAVHPLRAAVGAGRLALAVASVAADPLAPRTTLNDPIGTSRRYRVARLSLADARAAGHALGGTVNDVALAAVTAGLRDLLSERGEDLGGADLHALVPVSVRSDGEHRDLGNRVAAMIVPLPVGLPDAASRFGTVRRAAHAARADHQPELSLALLDIPEHWPEPLLAAAARLVHRQPFVNLVVSNVPGPPVPLYLAGAEMIDVFPVVPLARNLGVSIGILSYVDHLTVGLWADGERLGDVDVLVEGIERGFAELLALAGVALSVRDAPAAPAAGALREPASSRSPSRRPAAQPASSRPPR